MFVGVHALLAMNLQRPEIAISDDEGDKFINAVQKVLSHYPVNTTQKTLDWIALCGVTASIYGPRAIAIVNNRAVEKQQPTQSQPKPAQPKTATVTPLRPVVAPVNNVPLQPDMDETPTLA